MGGISKSKVIRQRILFTKRIPDKYTSFSELRGSEPSRNFRIRLRRAKSTTVVIALHGGGIESGTSEIAEAIAGTDFCFYVFEGTKSRGNGSLHITSTHFDEPRCLALISAADLVVAIHGESENHEAVYLGGLNKVYVGRMRETLVRHGFRVKMDAKPSLRGLDPINVCNRNRLQAGVQVELSRGYRRTFFQSLTTKGRKVPTRNFHAFVNAIREALEEHNLSHRH